MTRQELPVNSHQAIQQAIVRGRWLVLTASVLWSSSGFFAKAPYFVGWPGTLLAFWRAAFACVILAPLVRRIAWSWWMAPMIASFVLMNYTYLTAMSRGTAANAIWLQSTAPVWVLVVGVFFMGERACARDWLLLAFSVAGIGLIMAFEARGESFDAVLYGLASGMLYGGVVLSLRRLRDFDSAWLIALNHLAAAIVFLPFAAQQFDSRWPSGMQWPLLAGFGMLQMGLPYVLFARGLRSISGHEASGLGLLEPLLAPLWVWIAWGDKPAWWTLAGGGLILVGLALRYFLEEKRVRVKTPP